VIFRIKFHWGPAPFGACLFNVHRPIGSGPADSVTTDRLSSVRAARGRRSRVFLLAVSRCPSGSIVIRPSSILLFPTAKMRSSKDQPSRASIRPAQGEKQRHISHANPMPGRPVFRVLAASTGRHTDCMYKHFQIKKTPIRSGKFNLPKMVNESTRMSRMTCRGEDSQGCHASVFGSMSSLFLRCWFRFEMKLASACFRRRKHGTLGRPRVGPGNYSSADFV
jgi:hypothetical protein